MTPIKYMLLKKVILIIFLISICFKTYAQQLVTGKIIDKENGLALAEVIIKDSQNKTVGTSNTLGEFVLGNQGTFYFSKKGYHQAVINFLKPEFSVVTLEQEISQLNEIIVNANHIPKNINTSNTTINLITNEDIQRGNTINFNEILNRIPSVFIQSGALNTNKISIRGIGSRNLFGTTKIRAYFQDIPLTSGNGETNIEDFELGAMGRLEIIKGANSSIYGSGLGGTIHLIPDKARLNQTEVQNDFTLGSFGLIKDLIKVNYGLKTHSFSAIYSNTHSDGYRENNTYNRQTFTLNSNHYLNTNNDLSFLASFIDLKAFIPSSVNRDTYINNPKLAATNWKQSEGNEDTQRGILGITWNHQYNQALKHITSVFSSFKTGFEPRPFDILSEKTSAIGIRSRILGTHQKLNWTFGAELFKDYLVNKNFENLYQNFLPETGSVQGDKFSHFREKRTYYNIFFESNYSISETSLVTIGLNYNQTSYILKDLFNSDSSTDQSGTYEFKGMLSPKLGFTQHINNNLVLYTSVSHGFSPPTTAETLLPDGLINNNIKPETGWNFELGTRYKLLDNRLHMNLAIFRLDVRNLLVARRTGNDKFIGVNAGRTQHDGLELILNYQWLKNDFITISPYASYTLNNFKFKSFIDDGKNFSGNKLTGVPSNLLNLGIDIKTHFGWYSSINYQYVGKIPMNDMNSLFSDAYNLTNIKLGYKNNFNKHLNFNVYFGLNNLFNTHYASQILINAMGFNGAAPRYYYPGEPINYYTGLNLKYNFN
ncbi:TonB-dependent receptor family protein [Siansivirga zeaxanthinifaciens]|uniref:TonB-dependent receptor n=1 Tax=Siansivirga zeaxanthinifaciens CC-SAMT-1 TaxID=1454006 RepID=A0A0C5W9A4_9FLAO|nr:TonB-dependent receptor [Siansivirga zeaxanthinifaciens]AJR03713.1 TonB-dependent receptor [Siansivirga zeaxanthinifaciens CC-SAMT-1]